MGAGLKGARCGPARSSAGTSRTDRGGPVADERAPRKRLQERKGLIFNEKSAAAGRVTGERTIWGI